MDLRRDPNFNSTRLSDSSDSSKSDSSDSVAIDLNVSYLINDLYINDLNLNQYNLNNLNLNEFNLIVNEDVVNYSELNELEIDLGIINQLNLSESISTVETNVNDLSNSYNSSNNFNESSLDDMDLSTLITELNLYFDLLIEAFYSDEISADECSSDQLSINSDFETTKEIPCKIDATASSKFGNFKTTGTPTCPHCLCTFYCESQLHRHLESKICLFKFMTANNSSKNKFRSITGKYQVEHNNLCKKCPKIFHRKFDLELHKLDHPVDEQSYYECSVCMKSFISLAAMQQHRITHINVKKYKLQTFKFNIKRLIKKKKKIH